MDFSSRDDNNSIIGIFFLRQFISCSAVMVNSLIFGLYMGATTVIVPQLRQEANSVDSVTPEMASWLSSISSYCAIPWGFVLPLLAYRFGRKHLLILVSVNVLIGNVVFYYSTNIIELIISQALQALLVASILIVTVMVMSEYTSPRYRGILLTLKAVTFYWGVWISNIIGTYYHWRNIAIVIFICGIYNLSSIFYYESPYWLATKGRFDECSHVHRWLKGTYRVSEEELRKLILYQQEHLNYKRESTGRVKVKRCMKIFYILGRKKFYKPFMIASLPILLFNFSGKMVYTIYAIDILNKVTSSEKVTYNVMLILDGVTVLSMYLGCVLSKYLTRRIHLLIFSTIAICCLYVLSVYLYMIKLYIVVENSYVSLVFLTGFSISISCGPLVISSCCSAELSPLRYRSYFLCCIALLDNILYATILKLGPFILTSCDVHGAFLLYAIASSIFVCLIYKYVPETKDKTIQQIQDHIAGIELNKTEIELLPLEKPA